MSQNVQYHDERLSQQGLGLSLSDPRAGGIHSCVPVGVDVSTSILPRSQGHCAGNSDTSGKDEALYAPEVGVGCVRRQLVHNDFLHTREAAWEGPAYIMCLRGKGNAVEVILRGVPAFPHSHVKCRAHAIVVASIVRAHPLSTNP